MERPRGRGRRFAAAMTVAIGLLAGSQAVVARAADAASTDSPICGAVSCVYTRTGQSLFRVPSGVTLLQVDVIGAGVSATAKRSPSAVQTSAPKSGEAMEVQGSVALTPGENTLEVVVGGKDTLGGTTSEIMTSSDSTSQVLVAADGVPVPTVAKGGKSAKDHKKGTSTKHAKPAKPAKKATHPTTAVNRLVVTPNRIPAGGTLAPASRPARVVISWRAPSQAPEVISSRSPVLIAGMPSTFVVRAVSATAPKLSVFGSLPLGLTFRDQGNGTATIGGVAEIDGVYPLRLTVTTDADPTVTQRLHLVVRGGLIRLGSVSRPGGTREPMAVMAVP